MFHDKLVYKRTHLKIFVFKYIHDKPYEVAANNESAVSSTEVVLQYTWLLLL